MTPNQRKLESKLHFIKTYDGGGHSKNKAKKNGRRRVKLKLNRARRLEGRQETDAQR